MEIALNSPGQVMFRQMLFAKIVPAIKKMDLLSRRASASGSPSSGILQFENWGDPFADLERSSPSGSPAATRILRLPAGAGYPSGARSISIA